MHCILWLLVVEDNVLMLREVHKCPFILWNKNDVTDFKTSKTKTNEQKMESESFSANKCERISELGGQGRIADSASTTSSWQHPFELWIFPIIAEPAGASNPCSLSSFISFLSSWGLLTESGWGWSFMRNMDYLCVLGIGGFHHQLK